jgi:hypothetical protein
MGAKAYDEATALVIEDTQQAGLQPPTDLGEYFPQHPPREAQALEVVSEIGMSIDPVNALIPKLGPATQGYR